MVTAIGSFHIMSDADARAIEQHRNDQHQSLYERTLDIQSKQDQVITISPDPKWAAEICRPIGGWVQLGFDMAIHGTAPGDHPKASRSVILSEATFEHWGREAAPIIQDLRTLGSVLKSQMANSSENARVAQENTGKQAHSNGGQNNKPRYRRIGRAAARHYWIAGLYFVGRVWSLERLVDEICARLVLRRHVLLCRLWFSPRRV